MNNSIHNKSRSLLRNIAKLRSLRSVSSLIDLDRANPTEHTEHEDAPDDKIGGNQIPELQSAQEPSPLTSPQPRYRMKHLGILRTIIEQDPFRDPYTTSSADKYDCHHPLSAAQLQHVAYTIGRQINTTREIWSYVAEPL